MGLPNTWGAHSTRGAAVAFYKKIGLCSDSVASLGQWKDLKAFAAYYLRLHAAERASSLLTATLPTLVHNTSSPLPASEPDMSYSPPKEHFEGGRHDIEGEEAEKGEPTHPPSVKKRPADFSFSPAKRPCLQGEDHPEGKAVADVAAHLELAVDSSFFFATTVFYVHVGDFFSFWVAHPPCDMVWGWGSPPL